MSEETPEVPEEDPNYLKMVDRLHVLADQLEEDNVPTLAFSLRGGNPEWYCVGDVFALLGAMEVIKNDLIALLNGGYEGPEDELDFVD